jgi:hypothetical protein
LLSPDVLQQTPLQFQSVDANTYLVSHPGLFWPVSQAATAQAVAQQLSSQAPGWGTVTSNGPQGYGVYMTYQPGNSGTSQVGILSAIQQVVRPDVLQQAPLQLQSLDGSTYLVLHPGLFWPVNQAATAQGVAQQLLRQTPGWGTTVFDGSQGYGIYLTYRPAA